MIVRIPRWAPLLFAFLLSWSWAWAEDYTVKRPPKSLDELYFGKSKQPKWLDQMRALGSAYGGVFVDVAEGDWDNASTLADEFLDTYEKTSKLIPEWKDYFDLPGARKFAASVKSKNPKEIRDSAQPVSKTCKKCHAENYISVWTRYYWPSPANIKIMDPVEDREVKYVEYMALISDTMRGITTNFREGQFDRAWKSVDALGRRLQELKSVCTKCHVTEYTRGGGSIKQFFVGDEIFETLQDIRKGFATGEPNREKFWKDIESISQNSCKSCHLVHQPSAIIQRGWDHETPTGPGS